MEFAPIPVNLQGRLRAELRAGPLSSLLSGYVVVLNCKVKVAKDERDVKSESADSHLLNKLDDRQKCLVDLGIYSMVTGYLPSHLSETDGSGTWCRPRRRE